jgi:hypothetical protein
MLVTQCGKFLVHFKNFHKPLKMNKFSNYFTVGNGL